MSWKSLKIEIPTAKKISPDIRSPVDEDPDDFYRSELNYKPRKCKKCKRLFTSPQNYQQHFCWPCPKPIKRELLPTTKFYLEHFVRRKLEQLKFTAQ